MYNSRLLQLVFLVGLSVGSNIIYYSEEIWMDFFQGDGPNMYSVHNVRLTEVC